MLLLRLKRFSPILFRFFYPIEFYYSAGTQIEWSKLKRLHAGGGLVSSGEWTRARRNLIQKSIELLHLSSLEKQGSLFLNDRSLVWRLHKWEIQSKVPPKTTHAPLSVLRGKATFKINLCIAYSQGGGGSNGSIWTSMLFHRILCLHLQCKVSKLANIIHNCIQPDLFGKYFHLTLVTKIHQPRSEQGNWKRYLYEQSETANSTANVHP